ncbi:MAG: hypothetical protein FRX48_01523 [Lasallia pustulata]|uniref:Stc1 domain-containing protein n=1 Tax=Lasallia pustulata TaxID=136370 RepID=A0A5M8PYH1_9LECA|nr:MAG: hypothetical protein FRX48_01523 [Lasallia pustulata]
MPPNSLRAGGYSDATAKKLEKIVLPDLIRCKECKKVKIPSSFSRKQLSDLRYRIFTFGPINGTGPAYVKCRLCTGQQVNEMTCVVCDAVKGLDGFSKAQRRNPDKARCLECVRDHLSVEPGLEMDEEEGSDSDDEVTNRFDSDDEYDHDSDAGAPLSDMSKLQLDPTNADSSSQQGSATPASAVENASQGPSTTITADGTTWQEQPRTRYAGVAFTGYDSHGVAHARIRAPSTSLTDQSWPSPTPRSGNTSFGQSSNRRFPKPPGAPHQGIPVIIPKKKSKGSRTLSTEGDDDDSDDDDDFFTV